MARGAAQKIDEASRLSALRGHEMIDTSDIDAAWTDPRDARVERLARHLAAAFGHGAELAGALAAAESLIPMADGSIVVPDADLVIVPDLPIALTDGDYVVIPERPIRLTEADVDVVVDHRAEAARIAVAERRVRWARLVLRQSIAGVATGTVARREIVWAEDELRLAKADLARVGGAAEAIEAPKGAVPVVVVHIERVPRVRIRRPMPRIRRVPTRRVYAALAAPRRIVEDRAWAMGRERGPPRRQSRILSLRHELEANRRARDVDLMKQIQAERDLVVYAGVQWTTDRRWFRYAQLARYDEIYGWYL